MADMNAVSLREAINKVSMAGYLKEKNLEVKTGRTGEYIRGDVVIVTGENSEHRVHVMSNRYMKAAPGEPQKETRSWASLYGAMRNYHSLAELMKNGMSREEALTKTSLVRVSGARLVLNEYWNTQSNSLSSALQIQASFLTEITSPDRKIEEPRFEISGYLEKLIPEYKNDDETGRVFMHLIVPVYGGRVTPMQFVTTKEAGAYITNHYEIGKTVHVYGQIVNTVTTEEVKKEGFMRTETEFRTTRVHEFLVDNGEPEPYPEESIDAYAPELIQSAMKVRETEYIPGLRTRAEANKAATPANNSFAPTAAASGFTF